MNFRRLWSNVALIVLLVTLANILPRIPRLGRSSGDIFSFWAAAVAFLEGLNPYDPAAVKQALSAAFPGTAFPRFSPVYNPPWIFSLIAAFGLIPFDWLYRIWFVATLSAFAASYFLIGNALDRVSLRGDPRREILLLVLSVPFCLTVALGQLSPVMLISVAGFIAIAAERKTVSGSFAAGLCLSLASFKPHLLLVLYFFIFLESLSQRQWSTIGGLALGTAVLAVLPLAVQPEIYQYYFATKQSPRIWFTPTLGAWLYDLAGRPSTLLLFVPAPIIAAVFALHWRRHAAALRENLLLLPLAVAYSGLAAPYQWTYDFAVLTPALLWTYRLLSERLASKRAAFYWCLLPSAILWLQIGLMTVSPWWRSMHYAVSYVLVLAAITWSAVWFPARDRPPSRRTA